MPLPLLHRSVNGALKIDSRRGRKRRFGITGAANVILTNAVLQALLASNVVNIAVATLTSQAVNTIFGYTIYGKLVFRAQGLRQKKPVIRYTLLMTAMWILNTGGIELGATANISKNIAALAMVPVLAMLSYVAQKNWVFR
ncbi:GtrA family protein [Prochlorococcus sp. MIT 1303]|uniref:GtrA family protein n=1 Tax=Prochlorococcus sp. MIT 1303 TaxID=1723647 RepID=UPI0007B3BF52|nr:GtrA family protein [Prochlorococcus sp. MIT 1303]